MLLALEQAQAALEAGEVPVGAVLVEPRGRILAACADRVERDADPTAHAEILALRRGAQILGRPRLVGCVLITTLEPCAMCAAALVQARVAGLVFGAADEQAGAVISRAEYLDAPASSHAVWHLGGLYAAESAALLQECFARLR